MLAHTSRIIRVFHYSKIDSVNKSEQYWIYQWAELKTAAYADKATDLKSTE